MTNLLILLTSKCNLRFGKLTNKKWSRKCNICKSDWRLHRKKGEWARAGIYLWCGINHIFTGLRNLTRILDIKNQPKESKIKLKKNLVLNNKNFAAYPAYCHRKSSFISCTRHSGTRCKSRKKERGFRISVAAFLFLLAVSLAG